MYDVLEAKVGKVYFICMVNNDSKNTPLLLAFTAHTQLIQYVPFLSLFWGIMVKITHFRVGFKGMKWMPLFDKDWSNEQSLLKRLAWKWEWLDGFRKLNQIKHRVNNIVILYNNIVPQMTRWATYLSYITKHINISWACDNQSSYSASKNTFKILL